MIRTLPEGRIPNADCRKRLPRFGAFGNRSGAFGIRHLAFGIVLVASVSCGKKGPPLAPVLIVPAQVTDLAASRFGDQVIVRFTPPDKNTNNSTPADLARVEVYALSVANHVDAVDASDVVSEGARVGSLDMVPTPAAEGREQPSALRRFSETLTADAYKLWEGKKVPTKSTASAASGALAADLRQRGIVVWIGRIGAVGSAGIAVGKQPPQPLRWYAFVPVSARGRRGAAATVAVPLADAPSAPAPPLAAYTETAIELRWVGVEKVAGYNVYERGAGSPPAGSQGSMGSTSSIPLNEAPLREPVFQDKRLEFGKARCYSVTSVATVATRRIESPMSDPSCVTPLDTFPPPTPAGLAAVAAPGGVSLIWDAVPAGDLAGYLVLRADAPDGTLQALTPEPIKDTTYRDAAVTPGTRYAYAVVAVDRSNNRSAPSAKVEEIAH